MAYVTGKSGVVLLSNTSANLHCQLEWSEQYDIATNSSMLIIDKFQLKTTSYFGEYYLNGTVKINGGTVIDMNRILGTHYVGLRSSNVLYNVVDGKKFQSVCPISYGPISHETDGKKNVTVEISFTLYNANSGVTYNGIDSSSGITLTDIPRFATITSAPNFTDEENPTITYSNPAGTNVTSLRAYITLDGHDPNIDASVAVAYRNLPLNGTSYTFDDITPEELYKIYYTITDGNSRQVYFKIETVIGNTRGYSQVARTFTIANPNPTINPTIVDTDDLIIAKTGDNKKLVKYYSNASITSNAAATKYSTLTSVKVTCGSKSITSQNGVINDIDSGTFTFYVKDSRGNETVKSITPNSGVFSFIDYVKPTCVIANNLPDTDGKMLIEVSGNYYNGNIGNTPNTLTVEYRYKTVGGSYSDWKPVTYKSVNGTLYYASTEESGLNYQTSYVFQARAIDIFEEVISTEKTVKSEPVFDWGENDFKFNVPVYDEFSTIIRNGKAAYTGSGTNAVDPNTTNEELCYTNHSNGPRGEGYWFFIKTTSYVDPVGPAAKSQLAIPSGAPMSVYHRYQTSDSGWSAWRRHLNEDEHFSQTKLLWTNASPTSAFAAQTLAISLADYEIVMIESKQGSTFCNVGEITIMFSRDSYYPCTRDVTTTTTGISFGSGLQRTECPGSGTATVNGLCIPRRIYGIKGVIK